MVSPNPRTKLTYEDYARTPDDERWELIDGELFRMPSPNIAHQRISMKMRFLSCFHSWKTGTMGEVFARAHRRCVVGHGHGGAGLVVRLQ